VSVRETTPSLSCDSRAPAVEVAAAVRCSAGVPWVMQKTVEGLMIEQAQQTLTGFMDFCKVGLGWVGYLGCIGLRRASDMAWSLDRAADSPNPLLKRHYRPRSPSSQPTQALCREHLSSSPLAHPIKPAPLGAAAGTPTAAIIVDATGAASCSGSGSSTRSVSERGDPMTAPPAAAAAAPSGVAECGEGGEEEDEDEDDARSEYSAHSTDSVRSQHGGSSEDDAFFDVASECEDDGEGGGGGSSGSGGGGLVARVAALHEQLVLQHAASAVPTPSALTPAAQSPHAHGHGHSPRAGGQQQHHVFAQHAQQPAPPAHAAAPTPHVAAALFHAAPTSELVEALAARVAELADGQRASHILLRDVEARLRQTELDLAAARAYQEGQAAALALVRTARASAAVAVLATAVAAGSLTALFLLRRRA
jgi:hypothetical protein